MRYNSLVCLKVFHKVYIIIKQEIIIVRNTCWIFEYYKVCKVCDKRMRLYDTRRRMLFVLLLLHICIICICIYNIREFIIYIIYSKAMQKYEYDIVQHSIERSVTNVPLPGARLICIVCALHMWLTYVSMYCKLWRIPSITTQPKVLKDVCDVTFNQMLYVSSKMWCQSFKKNLGCLFIKIMQIYLFHVNY